MLADTIRFVAGPSLIISVVVLVLLAVFGMVTKGRDSRRSDAALSQIRRCQQCGQLMTSADQRCGHCGN